MISLRYIKLIKCICWCLWSHHQGYIVIQVIQPGLIRPWLVSRWQTSYHASVEFLSWAAAILRPSLPNWWCCRWLSSSHLWWLGCWRLWPKNRPHNLYIPPRLGSASIQPADSCWSVLGTWELPLKRMGLSATAAQLALWSQTPEQYLEAGWWQWCGRGTSAAACRPPVAPSPLQRSGCL